MKVRIDPLDTAYSKYMRMMVDNKCEYCGGEASQLHHFHGRRKLSTRYDSDNVCAVCFTCHQEFHQHPDIHTDYWKKRIGSERYEQLNIRSRMVKTMGPQQKKELLTYYKERIKSLEVH